MDDVSSERYSAAAKQMEIEGFSDAGEDDDPLSSLSCPPSGRPQET